MVFNFDRLGVQKLENPIQKLENPIVQKWLSHFIIISKICCDTVIYLSNVIIYGVERNFRS